MNRSRRGVVAALGGALTAALLATGTVAAPAGGAPEKAPASAPSAAPAPAAGTGEPDVTTATYQDWLVRCVTPPSAARICEATQTIQVQAQGQALQGGPIAVIAVGKLAADGPLRVAVQLPAGIWLPAGAKLQVSEKGPSASLEFKRCLQGCFAEAEVDKGLEQGLRSATGSGSIRFEDGARRPLTVPFSFRGFAAALKPR